MRNIIDNKVIKNKLHYKEKYYKKWDIVLIDDINVFKTKKEYKNKIRPFLIIKLNKKLFEFNCVRLSTKVISDVKFTMNQNKTKTNPKLSYIIYKEIYTINNSVVVRKIDKLTEKDVKNKLKNKIKEYLELNIQEN